MILQTLKRKRMHGYALAQHIKAVSDDLLQIEEGSLYPALQRMCEGWLKSEMGLSARNRPVRIFQLTAAGRKHLEEERSKFELTLGLGIGANTAVFSAIKIRGLRMGRG
jgi:DNA-binding PadR family transcriptional regulator